MHEISSEDGVVPGFIYRDALSGRNGRRGLRDVHHRFQGNGKPSPELISTIDTLQHNRSAIGRVRKLASRDAEAQREIRIYEGEPMSSREHLVVNSTPTGGEVYIGQGYVEPATEYDIAVRHEEQLERAKRMLEIGQRLTPQWFRYVLHTKPELLLNDN